MAGLAANHWKCVKDFVRLLIENLPLRLLKANFQLTDRRKGLQMANERTTPTLSWTRDFKLLANGARVTHVTWYDSFVELSTSRGGVTVPTDTFDAFVSPEWDPSKFWAYTSQGSK